MQAGVLLLGGVVLVGAALVTLLGNTGSGATSSVNSTPPPSTRSPIEAEAGAQLLTCESPTLPLLSVGVVNTAK
jgi:hypothetical protein